MKKNILLPVIVLMLVLFTKLSFAAGSKDPIKIEVITKHTSFEEALKATKDALLKEKFVATNGIQEKSFTATRTTNAKADYYVADVSAEKTDGKIKITISFVKVGTGLLKLQKVADAVKTDLEK